MYNNPVPKRVYIYIYIYIHTHTHTHTPAHSDRHIYMPNHTNVNVIYCTAVAHVQHGKCTFFTFYISIYILLFLFLFRQPRVGGASRCYDAGSPTIQLQSSLLKRERERERETSLVRQPIKLQGVTFQKTAIFKPRINSAL